MDEPEPFEALNETDAAPDVGPLAEDESGAPYAGPRAGDENDAGAGSSGGPGDGAAAPAAAPGSPSYQSIIASAVVW